MKVVIIKYNAGNVQSVLFALERIGLKAVLSDEPEVILRADKIIFPGVGEAGSAMRALREKNLDKLIPSLKQPVLGICLGMQLLCKYSEEGDTKCMSVFETEAKKFRGELKIPQIGWNKIKTANSKQQTANLLSGMDATEPYFYFVHGYYVEKNEYTTSETSYMLNYSSAMRKNNFYAVQFHPERSGKAGEQLLRNFIAL